MPVPTPEKNPMHCSYNLFGGTRLTTRPLSRDVFQRLPISRLLSISHRHFYAAFNIYKNTNWTKNYNASDPIVNPFCLRTMFDSVNPSCRCSFLILCIFFLSITIEGLAAPISLELTGGSVIHGELVSWNGEQAVIRSEFGMATVKRNQLTSASIEKLQTPAANPDAGAARIAELEATIVSLRKDNAALRRQIEGLLARLNDFSSAPSTGSGAAAAAASNFAPTSSSSKSSSLSRSISSTGKRHNSHCRYFGVGRPCGPNDGIACKICGG
ncbi:MAG TPA: hypothetical protein VIT91_11825 [Chthoniobacterales bacterium]